MTSQNKRKSPPASALAGINTVLLDVRSAIRKVCGMMSPTKPIIPVNATEKPMMSEETMSTLFRLLDVEPQRLRLLVAV